MRVWVLWCLSLAASSTWAAPVRPLRFEYRRIDASPCPDEASIRSAIEGRLGFDPFDPKASARLQVLVEPSGAGFQGTAVLTDESGTEGRRLISGVTPDCSDLAAALPFALSVAVEAFAASAPAEVAPAPVREPIPEAAIPWGLTGTVRIAGSLGAAPHPALATGLCASVWRGSLSLSLGVRLLFPSSLTVAPGRIETWSVAGELAPGYRFHRFRVYGLINAGALLSRAINLLDATSARTPLISLGSRVEFVLPLGPWLEVAPFVEGRAALTRTSLRVGQTEVWVTPPIEGALGLSVSLAERP